MSLFNNSNSNLLFNEMRNRLHTSQANIKNLKRGFAFFMDMEKAELDRRAEKGDIGTREAFWLKDELASKPITENAL